MYLGETAARSRLLPSAPRGWWQSFTSTVKSALPSFLSAGVTATNTTPDLKPTPGPVVGLPEVFQYDAFKDGGKGIGFCAQDGSTSLRYSALQVKATTSFVTPDIWNRPDVGKGQYLVDTKHETVVNATEATVQNEEPFTVEFSDSCSRDTAPVAQMRLETSDSEILEVSVKLPGDTTFTKLTQTNETRASLAKDSDPTLTSSAPYSPVKWVPKSWNWGGASNIVPAEICLSIGLGAAPVIFQKGILEKNEKLEKCIGIELSSEKAAKRISNLVFNLASIGASLATGNYIIATTAMVVATACEWSADSLAMKETQQQCMTSDTRKKLAYALKGTACAIRAADGFTKTAVKLGLGLAGNLAAKGFFAWKRNELPCQKNLAEAAEAAVTAESLSSLAGAHALQVY